MCSKPRVYNLTSQAMMTDSDDKRRIKKNISITSWAINTSSDLHDYVLLTSQKMIISKSECKTKGNDQIRQRKKSAQAMTSQAEIS